MVFVTEKTCLEVLPMNFFFISFSPSVLWINIFYSNIRKTNCKKFSFIKCCIVYNVCELFTILQWILNNKFWKQPSVSSVKFWNSCVKQCLNCSWYASCKWFCGTQDVRYHSTLLVLPPTKTCLLNHSFIMLTLLFC